MILAVAILLAQPVQVEGPVMMDLRYLARHQRKNGAWGGRPPGCTCPVDLRSPAELPDVATRDRVAALIRGMDDDDFGRRREAQRNVVVVGAAAVGQLRDAAREETLEVRWRAAEALREIECRTTGDDVEVTAMVLTAFLGAGYTNLSREVYDDREFGAVVKFGLKYLFDRQAPDGSFEGGSAAAEAWAALALSQAYGMTGNELFRDHAQRAIDFIVQHRAEDARGLFYQVMALKSAELSQLTMPRDALRNATAALAVKRADEPFSIFNRAALQIAQIYSYKSPRLLDLSGIPGLHPSLMEMETIYVVDLALFQADGPRGPLWKAWKLQASRRVLELQKTSYGRCDWGAWEAGGTQERMRTSALATLSREHSYR